VTLGASLSESFTSFTTSRHVEDELIKSIVSDVGCLLEASRTWKKKIIINRISLTHPS
jgi:hypothetical protein